MSVNRSLTRTVPLGDDDVGVDRGGDRPVYRATYDEATDSPVVAIARTLAVATGREPHDLSPLGRDLDLDALVTLLDSGDEHLRVEFVVDGWIVTVDGVGNIAVQRDAPPEQ